MEPTISGGRGKARELLSKGEYRAIVLQAFDWVRPEVLDLVGNNELGPEDLVKLCQPGRENQIQQSEVETTYLVDSNGIKVQSSSTPKLSSFMKAVPNVLASSKLWMIFVGIRAFFFSFDASILAGFQLHGTMINYAVDYEWDAVMDYHLEC